MIGDAQSSRLRRTRLTKEASSVEQRRSASGPPTDPGLRTPGWWARAALRRWLLILVMVNLGLAAGLAVTLTQPVLYEARSTLVLSGGSGVLDPENALDLPAVAETVSRLAVSDTVLQDAAALLVAQAPPQQREELAQQTTIEWMHEHVDSRVPPGTSLVEITARDDPASAAARLARAVVASVTAGVRRLATDPQGSLRIDPFGPPTDGGQVSPTLVRNLLIGGNVGLLLGLLGVALFPGRPRQRRAAHPPDLLGADVVHLPRATVQAGSERVSPCVRWRPSDPYAPRRSRRPSGATRSSPS